MTDLLHSPAAERNREPIFEVLKGYAQKAGNLLELASGSGQHAEYMAARLPHLTWQPSDISQEALESIAARQRHGSKNLLPPLCLDSQDQIWPKGPWDLILCCNMIHISEWACTLALLKGAARNLSEAGRLLLYGPFFQSDVDTAQSNLTFHASLKSRNKSWGIRALEDLVLSAAETGLAKENVHPMPANNLLLVLKKVSMNQGGKPGSL